MPLFAGDRVIVRGEPWIVEDATAVADVTILKLRTEDEAAAQHQSTILLPFDRPFAVSAALRMLSVSRRRWMHYLHSELAATRGAGQIRAAESAQIDLLPFQLEPGLALIRGTASRFLLADEVGLGKTIQAGLMLAELQQRGLCQRVLILTPAALRAQWADELKRRFRIDAVIVDAGSVSLLAESLPPDVNPWAVHPTVVASIDFVKQPEVRQPIEELLWDMLIVDEAHHASASSQRREVVQALALRARHVVLLTATPHSGNDGAYQMLCELGQAGADDRMLKFRRTRAAVGLPRRRKIRLIRVTQTIASRVMHDELAWYTARLWHIASRSDSHDVRLVAMLLAKRSFSSVRSLRLSLERRLTGLVPGSSDAVQSPLPLWSDEDPSDEGLLPGVQAFERLEEERSVLEHLLHSVRGAEHQDRKLAALCRLLRRVSEPAIIFTEYRDTLLAMAAAVRRVATLAMLHGGQTAQERRDALLDFTSGRSRLLLATDVGAEGLNLQTTCRLIVNLELPWSPARLEQRIGRVDRIGQTRTVHVVNLLSDETAETLVLANLLQRLERIRLSDIEVAACVINRVAAAPITPWTSRVDYVTTVDLSTAAQQEAARICRARQYAPRAVARRPGHVLVSAVRSPCRHRGLSAIAFFRAKLVNHADQLVEDALIAIEALVADAPRSFRTQDVKSLAERIWSRGGPTLMSKARERADARAAELAALLADQSQQTTRRERAIAQMTRTTRLVQAGLFESRALQRRAHANRLEAACDAERAARRVLREADRQLRCAQDPQLAMLLIRC